MNYNVNKKKTGILSFQLNPIALGKRDEVVLTKFTLNYIQNGFLILKLTVEVSRKAPGIC